MGAKGWGVLLSTAAAAAIVLFCTRSSAPTAEKPKPAQPSEPAIDPVTDPDAMESAQSAAGTFLKKAIAAPLLERNPDGIKPFLAPDFRARFPLVEEGKRL